MRHTAAVVRHRVLTEQGRSRIPALVVHLVHLGELQLDVEVVDLVLKGADEVVDVRVVRLQGVLHLGDVGLLGLDKGVDGGGHAGLCGTKK